jgi:hypothetical protein
VPNRGPLTSPNTFIGILHYLSLLGPPRAKVEELFASLTEPKQLRWVEDADHFFTGKLDQVQAAIRAFLQETFPGPVLGTE